MIVQLHHIYVGVPFGRQVNGSQLFTMHKQIIKIGHTEFENWKSFANLLLPNRVRIALLDKKSNSIQLRHIHT